eukprot:SAG22_NODE_957_length_6316_cov_2.176130_5_plen_54_part_00
MVDLVELIFKKGGEVRAASGQQTAPPPATRYPSLPSCPESGVVAVHTAPPPSL